MNRFYVVVVGVISGVLLGLVGAFVQADRIRIGDRLLPYGVLLAVAFVAVTQLWLARHFQTRIAAVAVAVGWVIATQTLGDDQQYNTAIIVDATWSKIYMIACPIVIGIICTLPPLRPMPVTEVLPDTFSDAMVGGESKVISEPDRNE